MRRKKNPIIKKVESQNGNSAVVVVGVVVGVVSVKPSSADGFKIPEIGLADVRAAVKIGETPAEGRQRIERRSSGCDEIQREHHGERGDLAVSAAVRAMTEGGKGIRSVGWIHVVAGRNGVFGRVRGVALLAARQRVVLVVVVAHQRDHRAQILDVRLVSLEHQRPRGLVVREPVAVLLHQRRHLIRNNQYYNNNN